MRVFHQKNIFRNHIGIVWFYVQGREQVRSTVEITIGTYCQICKIFWFLLKKALFHRHVCKNFSLNAIVVTGKIILKGF